MFSGPMPPRAKLGQAARARSCEKPAGPKVGRLSSGFEVGWKTGLRSTKSAPAALRSSASLWTAALTQRPDGRWGRTSAGVGPSTGKCK